MSDLNRGAVLLRIYLAASGRAQADAARAVDVSDVTVHHWLHGRISPRAERREALAAWSGGAVPAESWGADPSAEDLAMLRATDGAVAEAS